MADPFEESLEYAVDLGGKAEAFTQAEDVCLAHSMRWMISQLLNKEFGARTEFQRVPWRDKIKRLVEASVRRPESKASKARTLYDGLKSNHPSDGEIHTPQATRKHLQDKFPAQITVDDPVYNPEVDLTRDVDAIKELAHTNGQVACMISLRTAAVYGMGARQGFYHAVAFFSRDGAENVRFFDPNMGEVDLPRENFGKWFIKYRSEWKSNGKMDRVNSISVCRVHAPDQVSEYVRHVKKGVLEKLASLGKDLNSALQIEEHLNEGEQDVLSTSTGLEPIKFIYKPMAADDDVFQTWTF